MAKSETGNPYTYDAEGQLWAGNLEGPDPGGSLKNTGLRIYVDHFVIRTNIIIFNLIQILFRDYWILNFQFSAM